MTNPVPAALSLSWLPTDSLTVDLAVQYLEREIDDIGVLDGLPSGGYPGSAGPGWRAARARCVRPARCAGSAYRWRYRRQHRCADFLEFTSLVLEWDLESHTVTSVTGYHETDSIRSF